VNYAEVAPGIDFTNLHENLHAAARLTTIGTLVSICTMLGLLGAIFALDLHGWGFILASVAAAGVPTAFAILWTLRLAHYSPAWATLDAVVREEWKSGTRLLPDWFKIPPIYRRLRVIPALNEHRLANLRRANWILADKFQITCFVFVLLSTAFGITLAFLGFGGLIIAAPLLILLFVMLGFVGIEWRSVRLLQELREYEKVTGRTVLPPDLTTHHPTP